jgi:tetratricopeptide (TPR) repeat protein
VPGRLAIASSSISGLLHLVAYRRNERRDDLEKAIAGFTTALRSAPDARGADRAVMLSNLSACLGMRFELAADAADLDRAIEAIEEAVTADAGRHPQRSAVYLGNLSAGLGLRFELAGAEADLDRAIDAAQKAVTSGGERHREFPHFLSNLGICYLRRYELTGNADDLRQSVAAGRAAVKAAGPGRRADAPRFLANLAGSLVASFELTGNLADLDEAITAGQTAVVAVPDDAVYLSNLATALARRFEQAGDRADLDEAIEHGRETVKVMPKGHRYQAMALSNLGAYLGYRFELTGESADLDEAISAGRAAVTAMSDDLPQRAMYLSNLGSSLHFRFQRTADRADLDEAIAVSLAAVEEVLADDPGRPRYLSNLASSLRTRYREAHAEADLDQAIAFSQAAVEAVPGEHPARAHYLANLGVSRQARSERAQDSADLEAAFQAWREASAIVSAPPQVRLSAALAHATAALEAGLAAEALSGYTRAVQLLPEVAWHGLERAVREGHLSRWAGLAADAAASAIQAGQPESAIVLLEQGRSVIWSQALQLRTDLGELAARDPDLARRLGDIRAVLDVPLRESFAVATGPGREPLPARREHAAIARRGALAREWDTLLREVRQLSDFEHFLAPTPYAALRRAADSGPVIIVNTSRLGCHALILTANQDVRVVPLPLLTLESAAAWASRLAGQARGAALREVLGWLWDTVAEPVLAALAEIIPPAAGSPPRVWWCPTGPLTMLPLHAAGRRPGAGEPGGSVYDQVVSSYAPTLGTLLRARVQPADRPRPRQLVVGLPAAPGQEDLPFVEQELAALRTYFPVPPAIHLIGPAATGENVLRALPECTWLHVAGHAYQHPAEPSLSAFVLSDGPLTIASLATARPDQAELAYLSACQTAVGAPGIPDESVHLAAVMQFLGYRQVVATLWPIIDKWAAKVADDIYAELNRGDSPDAARAARALHEAVVALRDRYPTLPLRWAPYLHFGP